MIYPGSGYVMRMRYGTLMRASLKYLSKIIDHSLKFFHHIDHVWLSHIVIQRVALCVAWCSVVIYCLSYCHTHTALCWVACGSFHGHCRICFNNHQLHSVSCIFLRIFPSRLFSYISLAIMMQSSTYLLILYFSWCMLLLCLIVVVFLDQVIAIL